MAAISSSIAQTENHSACDSRAALRSRASRRKSPRGGFMGEPGSTEDISRIEWRSARKTRGWWRAHMTPLRRLTSTSLLVFLTLLGSISISFGQTDEKAQLGRLMYSVFQCGAFAGMSDNEKEQARLFEVGLRAGREFLDAVNKGQITDEAKSKVVPYAVMRLLRFTGPYPDLVEMSEFIKGLPKELEGPSADFVHGRIFQDATLSAYEMAKVADPSNVLSKGLMGKARTKSNAQTKYSTNNCALLK